MQSIHTQRMLSVVRISLFVNNILLYDTKYINNYLYWKIKYPVLLNTYIGEVQNLIYPQMDYLKDFWGVIVVWQYNQLIVIIVKRFRY